MFARGKREGWVIWGNQADESYAPNWPTYSNHSQSHTDSQLALA
jgi:N6-adenosine-specific RNA methylase IME4